ncbi:hypothetical protein Ciccas_004271 [Cichlidogyrus casuarinus]|uniref:Uncharacterized protein n=1 Tax=Cichlidogyrus casuarinus TaxID=1844966 RepID=A0ABD2QFE5_9PLAT
MTYGYIRIRSIAYLGFTQFILGTSLLIIGIILLNNNMELYEIRLDYASLVLAAMHLLFAIQLILTSFFAKRSLLIGSAVLNTCAMALNLSSFVVLASKSRSKRRILATFLYNFSVHESIGAIYQSLALLIFTEVWVLVDICKFLCLRPPSNRPRMNFTVA